MGAPRYLYQRRGGPLVRWDNPSGRPPGQARASEAKSLGTLGSTDVFDVPRTLPRGGGPEYISNGMNGMDGMGCADGCGGTCKKTLAQRYQERRGQGSYIAVGDDTATVSRNDKLTADMQAYMKSPVGIAYQVTGLAMIYHGYKRHNGSILWGLLWGLTGFTGIPFALAQGFGKPMRK